MRRSTRRPKPAPRWRRCAPTSPPRRLPTPPGRSSSSRGAASVACSGCASCTPGRWRRPACPSGSSPSATTPLGTWRALEGRERFVWNKLITGDFRVGVSQLLLIRALAAVGGVDPAVIAHRLMGEWTPSAAFYRALVAPDSATAVGRPYPFSLAYPLDGPPAALGAVGAWQVEWKWDGIRAQLVRRAGHSFLWSRGEELVTERFPELAALAEHLPDGTVLDGEILPWRDGAVLPFAQLQRRIGRKDLGAAILAAVPVVLLAFDLIESAGRDVREQPLATRRAALEELVAAVADPRLQLSPLVPGESWTELLLYAQPG